MNIEWRCVNLSCGHTNVQPIESISKPETLLEMKIALPTSRPYKIDPTIVTCRRCGTRQSIELPA